MSSAFPNVSTEPTASISRIALALGMVGALGEELVGQLVGSGQYAWVHVGLRHSIGSATPRYKPWVVGSSEIVADDAFVCLTDDAVPTTPSPVMRFGTSDVIRAATLARDAGVRRLAVVAPLAALLQLGSSSEFLASRDEMELADMGFETLIIIRPTIADAPSSGDWLKRMMAGIGRAIFELVLPPRLLPLRARTAAAAILTTVDRAPRGVHVVGARDLMKTVEETLPELAPKRARLR